MTSLVMAGLALAVVACGSSGSNTSSSASGASSSPSATAAAGSSSGSASGLTPLKLGFIPNSGSAVWKLGIEHGIFKKHGLDLQLHPGIGSSEAIPLLLNGQLQLASGEMTGVVAAVAHGFGVQIVSSEIADYQSPLGDQFAVVAASGSGISSFKDLDGKTVAVNSLKGIWELALREAIAKDGGNPSSVKFIAIKFPDEPAALQQGRVDAIYSLQPFVNKARAQGGKVIGAPATAAIGPHSVGGAVYASKAYVDKNPDVIKRWTEALADAADYANAHHAQLRTTISELTGAPPSAVAKLPLPWYANGVDRRSAKAFAALMVKYGVIKSAPALNTFVWARSPAATNLKTPPPGLKATG